MMYLGNSEEGGGVAIISKVAAKSGVILDQILGLKWSKCTPKVVVRPGGGGGGKHARALNNR